MKYFVNENCIGCGMCAGICPHVFQMKDDGVAEAVNADVNAEDLEDAASAMDGCPAEAIEEA